MDGDAAWDPLVIWWTIGFVVLCLFVFSALVWGILTFALRLHRRSRVSLTIGACSLMPVVVAFFYSSDFVWLAILLAPLGLFLGSVLVTFFEITITSSRR